MKQIKEIGSSAVMDAPLARTRRNGSALTSKTHFVVTKTTATVDSTQFSTVSVLVQKSAGAEDVRYEKVASIKAAIDTGSYKVSASAVADALMGSMLG